MFPYKFHPLSNFSISIRKKVQHPVAMLQLPVSGFHTATNKPRSFLTRTKVVKQSYRQPVCPSPFDISLTLSSPPLASASVKRLGTGSLRHMRSRTPVSTELQTVTLYTPLGPRISFTGDSGSAGSPKDRPETCQASKGMCHCYFSFISLEVRISGSN